MRTYLWLLLVILSGVASHASTYHEMIISLPKRLHMEPTTYYQDVFALIGSDTRQVYKKLLDHGEMEVSSFSNESSLCSMHLNLTLQEAQKKTLWALQMLDSTFKPGSGLLDGNILWLGSYDECVSTTATLYMEPNDTMAFHPFKGQYCKAGIPIGHTEAAMSENVWVCLGYIEAGSIPFGELVLGLCLPSTCSKRDLRQMLDSVLPSLSKALNITTLKVDIVMCQKEFLDLDTRAIVSIVIMSILAGFLVLGTIYDVCFIQRFLHIQTKYRKVDDKDPLMSSEVTANEDGSGDVRGYCRGLFHDSDTNNIQEPQHTGTCGKFLLAFSMYTNGTKLLSTKTSVVSLGAVNGVRFISMTWVILGHSFAFCLSDTKNIAPFIYDHIHSWSFMAIINATLAVDTFFLLSGLLVGYLTLGMLEKIAGIKKHLKWWGYYYFHRFWRLTPAYALVMALYIPLMKYWYYGPFWMESGIEKDYCENSWWKSLLYINNFFSTADMCMAWGWYLANDMQFYVIAPLFLIGLYFFRNLGVFIVLAALICSFIATGVISVVNDLPMTLLGNGMDDTDIGTYFNKLYIRPYCRIGPYLIGLLLGYVLYKTKCHRSMSRVTNLIGWLLAAGCCLSVIYGNFGTVSGDHKPTKEETAVYSALHSSVWALGVAWVLYACATGYGGLVNTFLSWKLFVPLGRLTYLAYLIHLIILTIYYNSQRDPIYVNDLQITYYFLGHLMLSYAAAFILSLAFESPFMGLEKAFFRKEREH